MRNLTRPFLILFALCLPFHAFAAEAFGGFGISVAQLFDNSPSHQGAVVVLHVPAEVPAASSLRAGDIILEVDGQPTTGKDFKSVVLNMLRGPVDSSAVLTITRRPENQPFTVSLKRSKITP